MDFSLNFKSILDTAKSTIDSALAKAKVIPPKPEEPILRAEIGEGLSEYGKQLAEMKIGQLIETTPPEPTTPITVAKGIYKQFAKPEEKVKEVEKKLGVGEEMKGLPKPIQKVVQPFQILRQ